MNTNFYIARRLLSDKASGTNLSRLMVRIAMASVALGVAIMIVAVAVVIGFKNEIRNKAVGFNGNISLTNYDANESFESSPIRIANAFLPEISALQGVTHAQVYATKGGIIKTKDAIQGVMLKGVSSDFDWTFFEKHLVAGNVFSVIDTATTNSVLISKRLSALLNLHTGDAFEMYFIQEPPRVRKFTISGVYDAQLEEIDKIFILCDLAHIQRINGWSKDQVSGVEIFVDKLDNTEAIAEQISELAAYHITNEGRRLKVHTVYDYFSNLFDWLELLDLNVLVILSLMIIVAGFNMISGLLILLFEKISMIGLLKALGMRNANIQMVFFHYAAFILLKGLLFGNIFGIACCLIQQRFQLITLNPENYFVSVVPIHLDVLNIFAINIFAFVGIIIMLTCLALFITRISPDKTMRTE